MPTKPNSKPDSKSVDTGAHISEEAIRQRAYYLWDADGRPEGRGDHYWHLACAEAARKVVEASADGVARVAKGRNPHEAPAPQLGKATRSKAAGKAPARSRTAVTPPG